MAMKNARQTAFSVLSKIRHGGAYSNLALDSALEKCEKRDAALAGAIVYGVCERLLTVEYNLSLYLRSPLSKLRPEVLTALQIGAYQILFMDKIPHSAAVSESVRLVRENRCEFAAGLVNAVLRRVSENGLRLPDEADELTFLSIKYSCPKELVSLWLNAYGRETAIGVLEEAAQRPPVFLRVNTLKTSPKALAQRLTADGAEVSESGVDALLSSRFKGSPDALTAYADGLFHVQDKASALCCAALDVKEGETVFDLCSAPGGKAFTLAEQMNNTGTLFAFDIYPQRLSLISDGAKRLGITNIKTAVNDATVFNPSLGSADKILCDVPCSGLGVIAKKPEIRYKTLKDIDKLPDLQYLILCNSVGYLKPSGRLIYSTCTLNPAENQAVCDRFLEAHPDFSAVCALNTGFSVNNTGKYVTLFPHVNGSDGFFVAAFERKQK